MEAKEVIDDLRATLAEVKAEGQETVAIAALERYLETVLKIIPGRNRAAAPSNAPADP